MKKIWKNEKFFYGGKKNLNQQRPTTRQPTTKEASSFFASLISPSLHISISSYLHISISPYLHISISLCLSPYLLIFVPICLPISVPVQVYRSATTITQVYLPPPPIWERENLGSLSSIFFGIFFFEIFFAEFHEVLFCGCVYF